MARDFAGEELSGGKQSGGDALGSRRKRRGGSGVAVLRAREGERSSLRALCLVERLDAEWAGEVAEAAIRGGEPSSSEDAPRAGGEASSTLVGRGDSRGVKAAWGNEPTAASIGGGGSGLDRARAE